MIVGKTDGKLSQSIFLREIFGEKEGPPPEINLFNEKNNGITMQELLSKDLVLSCHDISQGGILIAIAKMCIKGNVGAKIKMPKKLINYYEYLFGEDQSRYIVELDKKNINMVKSILDKNEVYGEIIAETQENILEIDKEFSINILDLIKINTQWFEKYCTISK